MSYFGEVYDKPMACFARSTYTGGLAVWVWRTEQNYEIPMMLTDEWEKESVRNLVTETYQEQDIELEWIN